MDSTLFGSPVGFADSGRWLPLAILASLVVLLSTVQANPRASTHYILGPETVDGGGRHASSASYTNEGSLGGLGGLAIVASPTVAVMSGYIGALDVVGIVPVLTTAPATDITESGAILGGEVTIEGGSEVISRGIVWATDAAPTVEDNSIVTAGMGTGSFVVTLGSLSPGTTYHVRSYATTLVGTGYGSEIYFTTDTIADFGGVGIASFAVRSLLPGDRQVFHFTLAGPRIVSLATTGGASLRSELFDSEGNRIASFDLEELLLAGDYALHVFRGEDGGEAETFSLTIDASTVAASRPDLAVGASPAALLGVGLYAPTNQLAALISKKAKAVTGYASLSNRGNLPDVLVGSATGGSGLFAVSYFDPTGNITAGLLSGTYTTPEMEENSAPVVIRATITPNKKKLTKKKKKGKKPRILKKTYILSLRLSSTFDPAISDAASIRVQTK